MRKGMTTGVKLTPGVWPPPLPEGTRKGMPLQYPNVPVERFTRRVHHQGLSGKGRKRGHPQGDANRRQVWPPPLPQGTRKGMPIDTNLSARQCPIEAIDQQLG